MNGYIVLLTGIFVGRKWAIYVLRGANEIVFNCLQDNAPDHQDTVSKHIDSYPCSLEIKGLQILNGV